MEKYPIFEEEQSRRMPSRIGDNSMASGSVIVADREDRQPQPGRETPMQVEEDRLDGGTARGEGKEGVC